MDNYWPMIYLHLISRINFLVFPPGSSNTSATNDHISVLFFWVRWECIWGELQLLFGIIARILIKLTNGYIFSRSGPNTWMSPAVHVTISKVVPVYTYRHIHTFHIHFMQAHMHIYIHVETHIYTGTHMPSMDICGNTCTKQIYRNIHIGSDIHTLTYIYAFMCSNTYTFWMYYTLFMQNK